jgi:hypothetical protein
MIFFCSDISAQRVTIPSDGRFNFNIQNDVHGLDFITRLRPVTYQFDFKKFERKITNTDATYTLLNYGEEKITRVRRTGFIAQEVELAATESGYNFNGIVKPSDKRDHYSLSYESFVVPLVKAIQEQQELITNQQLVLQQQEKRIKSLEKDIDSMQEKMNALFKLMEKE